MTISSDRANRTIAEHLAGLDVQITWQDLDPRTLTVDRAAQRDTNPKRVEKIAANYTPILAGALVVTVTEMGNHDVADGMHRKEAAIDRGVKFVHCQVIEGLDRASRAKVFLALQRERKGVSPEAEYNVGLTAGERRETEIQLVVDKRGLRMGGSPSKTTIAAIRGVCRVWDLAEAHEQSGQILVARTIDILNEAWGASEVGDQWQTDIFQGLGGLLLANENPSVDTRRMVRTLVTLIPRGWVTEAQHESRGSGGSGGRPRHMAKAMLKAYNKGLSRKRGSGYLQHDWAR